MNQEIDPHSLCWDIVSLFQDDEFANLGIPWKYKQEQSRPSQFFLKKITNTEKWFKILFSSYLS